jgi:Ribosome-assembly protein 3
MSGLLPVSHQQNQTYSFMTEWGIRLDHATTKAIELIEDFSEQDPYDPASVWKDPEQIFHQLELARAEVLDAWNDYQKSREAEPSKDADETEFRVYYLDMITDSFADVLDELRSDPSFDVGILVDCLQSGMDFLTTDEKSLFWQDDNEMTDDNENDTSPHEKNRLALGFCELGA